jgi:L-lactate utilization protein LutB
MILCRALGATVIVSGANAATAGDGGTAPANAAQWCVIKHDGGSNQLKCYDNPITCVMAAIADASSCTQQSPTEMAVGSGASSAIPLPLPRPRVLSRDRTLTAAQRDQLFRDFVRWKDGSASKTN